MIATDPFARLMRQWETVHPYNFLFLIDIDRTLDRAALNVAAEATLREMLGIAGEVQLHDGIDPSHELAAAFLEDEAPVRIGCEGTGRFSFTFRHAAFDGLGGAIFINRTVLRAIGTSPPELEIADLREPLAIRHAARSIRDLLRMRKVHARSGRRDESPRDLVRLLPIDPALLHRLRAEAAPLGATTNDVLAARLIGALRALDPLREGRRRESALAIAVGMRGEGEGFSRKVDVAWFPVFSAGEPDLASIRDQTAREKQSRSWTRSRLEMRFASMLWPRIAQNERAHYMARNYVLTGGLTNLRVPGLACITRYQAAVATGPNLPIVVMAVTTGGAMTLTITWRAARFAEEEIDAVQEAMMR
jgi:hypothetical protein